MVEIMDQYSNDGVIVHVYMCGLNCTVCAYCECEPALVK